jgi:SSS family solute:Na+ symporter
MIAISLGQPKKEHKTDTIEINTNMFKVTPGFMIGSVIITGILAALYTVFW